MHLTSSHKTNNYYTFGILIGEGSCRGTCVPNRSYNGKELDRMHGLNLYDFSARQYDPAIGQFTSMDPLCEKYYHISPYAYCAGNPVKYVDPTGMRFELHGDDIQGVLDMLAKIGGKAVTYSLGEDGNISYKVNEKKNGKVWTKIDRSK
jgi:RHS repeat-associated protein